MAETPSTMAPLGMAAPKFRLPDITGKLVSLDDFKSSPVLLVAFLCNHCPFVKHIRQKFAEVARAYQQKGVAVVGVSSNDVAAYPMDGLEGMAEEARSAGYTFLYLFDESQEVAKAYRAACTPDLYVFDRERRLRYRGQFDDSRPGNGKPGGDDYYLAAEEGGHRADGEHGADEGAHAAPALEVGEQGPDVPGHRGQGNHR